MPRQHTSSHVNVSLADAKLFLSLGRWLPWLVLALTMLGLFLELAIANFLARLVYAALSAMLGASILSRQIIRRQSRSALTAVVFFSAWHQLSTAGLGITLMILDDVEGGYIRFAYLLSAFASFLFALLPIGSGVSCLAFALLSRRMGQPWLSLVWTFASSILLLGYGAYLSLVFATDIIGWSLPWLDALLWEYDATIVRSLLWTAFVLFAIAALLTLCAQKTVRTHIAHLCQSCGYDLTGIDADKCPECGSSRAMV